MCSALEILNSLLYEERAFWRRIFCCWSSSESSILGGEAIPSPAQDSCAYVVFTCGRAAVQSEAEAWAGRGGGSRLMTGSRDPRLKEIPYLTLPT
jgi:hypothetical protein